MRLHLISQIYSPEPELRVHSLASGLAARGHEVTAITCFPNYPIGRIYDGYRQRWRQWEERDGVRVLRLPLVPDHSRSVTRRAVSYFSFAASATLLAPILSGRADVVWVYHPPLTNAIPGSILSLLHRIPLILEVQDIWPETLGATGIAPSRWLRWMVGAVAKRTYRLARAIIVISPGFKRNLLEKGVPEEKIHMIPNWVDEHLYRPFPPDLPLARMYGFEGRFTVLYAGNIGPAQGLDTVLKAAERLRDVPHVQFVFVGDGLDLPRLEAEARTRALHNVRFLPRHPVEEMPRLFAIADALLVHLKPDPLFQITIPGKTQTYLASGRPIIMGASGDAARLIADAGAGIITAPGDPAGLAKAVRRLAGMTREEREAMGTLGREFFLANLSRAALLDRYERVFAQVGRGTGVRGAVAGAEKDEMRIWTL